MFRLAPSPLAALAVVLSATPAEPAAPPSPPWPLDARSRAAIDRRARDQGPPTREETRAAIAGAVPGFLLTALDLPAAEEHRRAKAAHADWLKRGRAAAAPVAVQRVLVRLVKELPPHQLPAGFRYQLAVLDRDDPEASSPGGGFVEITTGLIDRILADPARGEAAIALLLARQIGHSALGHCRRGWQLAQIEEDTRKGVEWGVPPGGWRGLLETKIRLTGRSIEFLYSLNQEYRADLFALHLCRNAGFDLDHALDGMRFLAARGADQGLARLRRLLQERDGEVDPEAEFGLFAWDRTRAAFVKCHPGDVAREARPIVFVHGLYGTSESWNAFLATFASQRAVEGRPLLVFRHPGNGSLARSGLLLHRQVTGVIGSPGQATFVCHSAGGLVFRWYAEKLGGAFDRAVLLATPHAGSDLTQLKFLLDVLEFCGAVRLGLNGGVDLVLAEGRGEIGQDLHPDSLFLRALGRDRAAAKRYHVFYGEWLSPAQARLLQAGFLALSQTLQPRAAPQLPEGLLRRQAERLIAALVLPPEIVKGDGVVSAKSANLPGAGRSTRLPLRHLAFRDDPEAIRLVLESITR
jgi:pimeloyl-ACP methyl ester carboxylesterase